MGKEKFIITIDGTAGSGKSTLAKSLSKIYNLKYLPTGIYYRKLAKILLDQDRVFSLSQSDLIKDLMIKIEHVSTLDLSDKSLYSDEVSKTASDIAKIDYIRDYFNSLQKKFIDENRNIILEGRDTGSIVAPNADIKIFLTADPKIRAMRRALEQNAKDIDLLKANIEKRDQEDSKRKISPLVIPKGSIEIDSSHLNIEELIIIVSNLIDRHISIRANFIFNQTYKV
jgi:cytidylate kinase